MKNVKIMYAGPSGKVAKEGLLKEREEEKVKLEAQEKEQKLLVANLKKKQRGLQNELNKKRREANQLNARIDRLIAEEIEKARKRAVSSGSAINTGIDNVAYPNPRTFLFGIDFKF